MLKIKFTEQQRLILKESGITDTEISNYEDQVYKMNKKNWIYIIVISLLFGFVLGKII